MKIGVQELLLVFIIALIVLGPDRLPLYAQKFGEAQQPLLQALEPVTELGKEVRENVEGIQKSFSDIGKPVEREKKPEQESLDTGTDSRISDQESVL